MTESIVDGPGPRHAFAPHPVPVEGLLHRVYVIFQESDGRVWAAGTDMMAPDPGGAELFVDRLNETLGVDRAERVALAARAFAVESEPAPGGGPWTPSASRPPARRPPRQCRSGNPSAPARANPSCRRRAGATATALPSTDSPLCVHEQN